MPAKKEFSHPLLELMGIPKVRMPSKKLVAFWTVSGALLGAYFWDRHERQKVRDYWVHRVEFLGQKPVRINDKFDKVRVYIAPPPSDFLENSLQHFRNFVKPVLTAAAVDHDLIIEERQGHIRSLVAQEMRDLRQGIKPQTDYLGTVIIGRGAYKEYINGLQEGLCGKLEAPPKVKELIAEADQKEKDRLAKRAQDNAPSTEGDDPYKYADETEYQEDKQAKIRRKYPVTPSYLLNDDDLVDLQPHTAGFNPPPLSVFKLPHLLGILMTPFRAYRWLNQRVLADELGAQAAGILLSGTRQFTNEDLNLAISDEEDWPNKFKSKTESEWMRPISLQPEIIDKLRVFNIAEREDQEVNSE